jgi:hypothetical protein
MRDRIHFALRQMKMYFKNPPYDLDIIDEIPEST